MKLHKRLCSALLSAILLLSPLSYSFAEDGDTGSIQSIMNESDVLKQNYEKSHNNLKTALDSISPKFEKYKKQLFEIYTMTEVIYMDISSQFNSLSSKYIVYSQRVQNGEDKSILDQLPIEQISNQMSSLDIINFTAANIATQLASDTPDKNQLANIRTLLQEDLDNYPSYQNDFEDKETILQRDEAFKKTEAKLIAICDEITGGKTAQPPKKTTETKKPEIKKEDDKKTTETKKPEVKKEEDKKTTETKKPEVKKEEDKKTVETKKTEVKKEDDKKAVETKKPEVKKEEEKKTVETKKPEVKKEDDKKTTETKKPANTQAVKAPGPKLPAIKIDFSKELDKIVKKLQKPGQKLVASKFIIDVRNIITANSEESILRTIDAAPVAKDGRTMLPVRYVAEALGFKVNWDQDTQTVTLKDNKMTVEIPIDTHEISVNGKIYNSDVKPLAKNGRTYLSIANIGTAIGLQYGQNIFWNQPTKEVIIIRNISK